MYFCSSSNNKSPNQPKRKDGEKGTRQNKADQAKLETQLDKAECCSFTHFRKWNDSVGNFKYFRRSFYVKAYDMELSTGNREKEIFLTSFFFLKTFILLVHTYQWSCWWLFQVTMKCVVVGSLKFCSNKHQI